MNESETQKKIPVLKCPRFWQISADAENSRANFAKGRVKYNVQWEYLVMPFRLCNAPSTFQRLMNTVFEKELNSFILVYLDDILIYSRSIGDHWGHLRCAFDKLRRAKYGWLHKCEFLRIKWTTSGSRLVRKKFCTSPEKVKAILDWPRPLSTDDIRSFLGLASYYHKFIRGFSQIAKPLMDLTRDKVV